MFTTLNGSYRQDKIIDGYKSVIWSERFGKLGDFEFKFPLKEEARITAMLPEDTIIVNSDTPEPMYVDAVKRIITDTEKYFSVRGRDMRAWLEPRISQDDYEQKDRRASIIAGNLLNQAVFNSLDSRLDIPHTTFKNSATDIRTFTYESTGDGLLDDVFDALDLGSLGFHCILQDNDPYLVYEIYSPKTRNLTFSTLNGSLISSQYVKSSRKLRNAAIVSYKASNKEDAKTLRRWVYYNGGKPTMRGRALRIIHVDATNVNPQNYPGDRLIAVLERLGKAELSKYRTIKAIDGEIPEYAPYQYRRDFYLGDIVRFDAPNDDGTLNRCVEYVWSIDETGKRGTPTFDSLEETDV